jgi:hypothetical protein
VIDCANSNKPDMPCTGIQGIKLVAGELGGAGECAVGVSLEKLIDRVVEAVAWPPCAGSYAARKPRVASCRSAPGDHWRRGRRVLPKRGLADNR